MPLSRALLEGFHHDLSVDTALVHRSNGWAPMSFSLFFFVAKI